MKIAIFATISAVFAMFETVSASDSYTVQGWKLSSDTTLPTLDKRFSEQGWETPHFCKYKPMPAREGTSEMMLVIPGGCIPFFGVASFTKP